MAVLVAGCSSSNKPVAPPAAAGTTTASTVPSADTAVASGSAVAATGPAPAATTPSATSAAATASPTPSVVATSAAPATSASAAPTTKPATKPTKAKPLSPYEDDLAVMRLRTWAAEAAKTINMGKIHSPAFDALMGAAMDKQTNLVIGPEVGSYYPGPIPFTPTRVTIVNGQERIVWLCVLAGGFAVDGKTRTTAGPVVVRAYDGYVQEISGQWLVTAFQVASRSCKGVAVARRKW